MKRDPVATGVLIALAVLGIIAVLWFIAQIPTIVGILLVSVVLATGIAPLVRWLEKAKLPPRGWHLPRGVAILLVYLVVVIVLGLVGTFVGTVVVSESIQLVNNAPRYYAAALEWFTELQQEYEFLPEPREIVNRLRDQVGVITSYTYRGLSRLIGFIANLLVIVTVFIVTYYILAYQEGIRDSFLRLIPPSSRRRYRETFSEMGVKMGGWLRGQLLLAFIVGAAISLFLWLIGIPYAFIIGVIGALAELIPMVGPIVAAVPAVLLVIFQPTWQIIAVIAFFIVLSQVEGNWLAPKIMKEQVGLNPLITVIALLVGGTLAGIVGALLAIPLAAGAQVFITRVVMPSIEKAEKGS